MRREKVMDGKMERRSGEFCMKEESGRRMEW